MIKVKREINERNIEVVKVFNLEHNKTISLNSAVSPYKEMERFFKKINNNKSYIVIGSGNGTLLEYLLNNPLKAKFYIIELFDEINYDQSYINKLKERHIYFYNSSNLNYIQISSAIRESLGMEFEILIHPNYEKLDKSLLNPVLEKIKMGMITAQINKNTEKYFMFEWLKEPLLNLSLSKMGNSLISFKEHFIGKPFILVASGPSLMQNLDFIKRNKHKAYIIASGSAVNGLVNNGIDPDFVTVIDASIINFTAHFKNTTYKGPLITTGTTNHQILKNHSGKILFTNLSQDTITSEERPDFVMIPTVPSVALYSLLITHFLGASDIYLVGQDLSLMNGKYYSSGVNEHDNMKKLGELIEVEDNQGSKVYTTQSLATTLESFNNSISAIQSINKDLRIYNLAHNGAKITDVPYKSAKDIQISKSVDKTWIKDIPKNKEIDYSYSREFLQKIKECKTEVEDVSKKINRMNSAAVTLKDLKKLLQLIKKLRKNEVLETHILNMIYSTTTKINNMFEFGFEDTILENKDRVEMLNKIKFFVEYIQQYLNAFEKLPEWSAINKGDF